MARAAGVEKKIVKVVNHTFNTTNLVKEGNPMSLSDFNDLDKNWMVNMKT